MANEGTEPVTEPAAPAAEPTAPVALVNHEGALSENWRDSLDENIRDKEVIKRVKDFPSAMTSLAHFESMVGADTMVRPSESSGDEAWNEYYKVGGRPDTAAEYGFQRPEGFPEEHYSEERATAAAEFMHKAGLSKKQAQALFAMHHDGIIKQLEDKAFNDNLAFETIKNGLVEDWGNAYEAKKKMGNFAINEGLKKSESKDPEFKDRVIEKINKDPDLLRFMGDLGKYLMPGSGLEIPQTANETPDNLDAQLAELMASDAFNNKAHPQHKQAMLKQDALMKKGAKRRR